MADSGTVYTDIQQRWVARNSARGFVAHSLTVTNVQLLQVLYGAERVVNAVVSQRFTAPKVQHSEL